MTYYSKKTTTITGGGIQRRWAGEAKRETILAWMAKTGLYLCYVEVTGIHKGRGVGIEHYTLRCESAGL